jgi:crotonobetainyl-CoA:carnitine CoA-transferase CaiB-like acyl-CoA transferase
MDRFLSRTGSYRFGRDPRFAEMKERLAHYDLLKQLIAPRLLEMTREDVTSQLGNAGIAVGPVNTVAEALEDPQISAREMVRELTHPEYGPIKQLGIPVKLSDTPGQVEGPPPRFGEHNAEVLAMLGYSESRIAEYRREGIVAEAEPSREGRQP